MPPRGRIAVVGAFAALALAPTVLGIRPPAISWAPQAGGHRYGWAVEPASSMHGLRWRCTPKRARVDQHSFLCGTDDGGTHWRRAFDVDSSWRSGTTPSLLDVLRWSRRAGVVSIPANGPSFSGHQEFWTRDGGRHWWRTAAFGAAGISPVCDFDSSEGECTWAVDFRRDRHRLVFTTAGWITTPNPDPSQPPTRTPVERTYRLAGWVPAGRLACRGSWTGSKGRRICDTPAGDGGLHAVPLGQSAVSRRAASRSACPCTRSPLPRRTRAHRLSARWW